MKMGKSESKKQRPAEPRTIIEKLLYLGIATFFLLPFVQQYSIEAVPLFQSDTHNKAVICLKNLLEQSLAKPFAEMTASPEFIRQPGYEDMDLEGRVEVLPHPEFRGMTLHRAQVRWGIWFFKKTLSLEACVTRTRP